MKHKGLIGIVIAIILAVGAMYFISGNTKTSKEESNIQNNSQTENTRISLRFDNKEIVVKLEDNESTKDLIKQLPLTVNFEDYASTEKIAYLDEKLSSDSGGYEPKTGDFAYYAPWGNLSFFYKDFRYSNSLIKLGEIESGVENMEDLDNKSVIIELVK